MGNNGSTESHISISALKSGDRREFARFVETHSPAIYRLALRLLGNEQDAEDILQETFIKSFQHIGSFDGRSKLSTWLYRIATNEALMLLRKQRLNTVSIDEPLDDTLDGLQEPLQIVDWTNLPEEELLSAEGRVMLDQAIDLLPESLRVTFVLRELEGFSTQETAQMLGLTEGAVKTRLSRARLQLREDLSAYFGQRLKGEVYDT